MAKRFEAGDILCSSGSDALFLVVEVGAAKNMPVANGVEMFCGSRQPCSVAAEPAVDCDLQGGQLYTDHFTGLMLLCIRPGRGPLTLDGREMTRNAKPAAMSR